MKLEEDWKAGEKKNNADKAVIYIYSAPFEE